MNVQPPEPQPPSPSSGSRWTLIVTNLIKLGGLAVALNEALVRADPRPSGIAVAAVALLCWAVSWWLGARGDGFLVFWLFVTAVAVADHIEQGRRRRARR
jgi:hypothetical protein